MKLVIVESPTKARKLSDFLGSGYQVESSVGHIVNLPKAGLNIDLAHDFAPKYDIIPEKISVVKKLRHLAQKASVIYLASDPDREGEAIAWHLQNVLLEKTQKPASKKYNFKRVAFHEITPDAVQEAFAKPGTVNLDLVNAQQARRVLDRIVGYQVSPLLWRKVRLGLSAGRVQSVALRLIVEREKEIIAFVPEEYWEVSVLLGTKSLPAVEKSLLKPTACQSWPAGTFLTNLVKIDHKKYEPKKEEEVIEVVQALPTATYQIAKLEQKERKVSSYPPFTTSTLQQAGANKLGLTSKQTMLLAQQLYEEGLITYHRTDSFNLSSKAITSARSFIKTKYGDAYLPTKPRIFAKKAKNAQEAHEAIRVTDIKCQNLNQIKGGNFSQKHQQLYDLIWRRFIASQMSEAIYEQMTVIIQAQKDKHLYELKSNGRVQKFAGWTKLFPQAEDKILPALTQGQKLFFNQILPEQKFTQPPARYNDASIIKKLEELGIGRPSTYAGIISVIISRGYVERQDKKFFATPVGMAVVEFLLQNLPQLMAYDFTAFLEEQLDVISRGEKKWTQVLHDFYTPFAQELEKVTQTASRVKVAVEPTGKKCPLCGETEGGEEVIRQGKYGKFLSCSRFPDCKYTQALSRVVAGVKCPLCQKGEVIMRPTRWRKNFFGCSLYPDCNWASWKKPQAGEIITPEQWAQQQAQREERKRLRAQKTQFVSKKNQEQKKTSQSIKKPSKKSKTKAKSKQAQVKKTKQKKN